MEKLKRIITPAALGFLIGWVVVGIYVFIFPPQGALYGGPTARAYMAYGGFVGLFIGIVRAITGFKSPDNE